MVFKARETSDASWADRDSCGSFACALALVSERLATVTSLFCRRYDDYRDPHGEYKERNENENDETEDDADNFQSNRDKLHDSLQEIADFASKHSIPFDFDVTMTFIEGIADQNDDAWNNSSIGC